MIVIGVGALVRFKRGIKFVVIGGYLGSEFGFFQSIINNLMSIADPTTLRLVGLVRI